MNENKNRSDRMAKRRKQVRLHIFLLTILVILCTVCAILLIVRFTPTSRRMSSEDYFGTLEDGEAAIVLQDQILTEQRALVSESGSVYLPYELVRDSLNERFFLDEENAQVLFTTATQTFEIPVGSASYTLIDGTLADDPASEASYDDIILLRGKDGTLYLNLDFLAQYTDIGCAFDEDTPHVFIQTKWGSTLTSEAAKEAAVRYQGGIKSPIVADLLKGEKVTVLEEGKHWLKVLTKDGYIGWVKANRMTRPQEETIEHEGFTPVSYPSIHMDEKVELVWHMVTTQADNQAFLDATAAMTGINVVSPTWFSLVDNEGNVESLGSKTYVEQAHGKGLQVWALLDDFSPDMDNSVMMASTASRRNCISQLIGYSTTLGTDGINIDFEHVDPGDAYTYTQFVRELSIACRSKGLVLSVDTFPPYEFNAYLNRREIAHVCDYLINMGYDEHYFGSETAGSVASLGYEEGAITNLLLMGVPADKLISAVPFYTRIWYTSTDGEDNTYVNSEVLSMKGTSATLESWNLTPTWDPSASQNYVSWYTDDNVLCEIWIEDEASLRSKALLVSSRDLAGIAFWALGFQDDAIWDIFPETISLPKEKALQLIEQLKDQDTSMIRDAQESGTEAETSFPGQAAG